jgi:hypothetical protein
MVEPFFDKREQYEQVAPALVEGEQVLAVFDCKGAGTGFIGITDKRLIFYDKAFMLKRKALVSIPYSRITAVASVDEGSGFFGATSELAVRSGSEEYEFEFRGGDKAERAYKLIMTYLLK